MWTKNFQMYKLDLEKAEEPEIKLLTFVGSSKKQGNYRENIYCFINYAKVRKQQLELDMKQDWFQIGKGGHQGYILSPCLFNLYAEYIMWNAGLEEAQAGIKIAGRNISNISYSDDTTPMAESEEN